LVCCIAGLLLVEPAILVAIGAGGFDRDQWAATVLDGMTGRRIHIGLQAGLQGNTRAGSRAAKRLLRHGIALYHNKARYNKTNPIGAFAMPTPLEIVEAEALKLPAGERALLAEHLLASLDQDAENDAAWAAEVASRLADIDSGASGTVALQTALAQARAAIK
jgi:putative addiction module component (TIGR02574 family)